jgi:hypothetical protein
MPLVRFRARQSCQGTSSRSGRQIVCSLLTSCRSAADRACPLCYHGRRRLDQLRGAGLRAPLSTVQVLYEQRAIDAEAKIEGRGARTRLRRRTRRRCSRPAASSERPRYSSRPRRPPVGHERLRHLTVGSRLNSGSSQAVEWVGSAELVHLRCGSSSPGCFPSSAARSPIR